MGLPVIVVAAVRTRVFRSLARIVKRLGRVLGRRGRGPSPECLEAMRAGGLVRLVAVAVCRGRRVSATLDSYTLWEAERLAGTAMEELIRCLTNPIHADNPKIAVTAEPTEEIGGDEACKTPTGEDYRLDSSVRHTTITCCGRRVKLTIKPAS